MDPNQALTDLIQHLLNGDEGDALECASELAAWVEGGGFAPDWSPIFSGELSRYWQRWVLDTLRSVGLQVAA